MLIILILFQYFVIFYNASVDLSRIINRWKIYSQKKREKKKK